MFDVITKREYWGWIDEGFVDTKRSDLRAIQEGFILSRTADLAGCRVLAVGAGSSRILDSLSAPERDNECWSAEPADARDAPSQAEIDDSSVRRVECSLGEFSDLLPTDYFDLVFTVSVLHRVAVGYLEGVFADMGRILKPGGAAVHAIDIYVFDHDSELAAAAVSRERVRAYRSFDDRTDIGLSLVAAPAFGEDDGFRCSFASNSDLTMHQWNQAVPSLSDVREVAQAVSIKAEWVRREPPATRNGLTDAARLVQAGRDLLAGRVDGIYDVLRFLRPGHLIDVGAETGSTTAQMLESSPMSRVTAFEPFPGNLRFLDERFGNDDRVGIVRAAVADSSGESAFFVGQTVTGSEYGWEQFVGSSAVGYLVDESATSSEESISVPTVRIDDYVGPEGVRLLKVDVQGGELGVLQSAERSLRGGLVDVMYVEFGGDLTLLNFILNHEFVVFDSDYQIVLADDPDLSGWDVARVMVLPTGRSGCRAWPHRTPADPAAFSASFRSPKARSAGHVETDLVCIRSGFLDEFLHAAESIRVELPGQGEPRSAGSAG